MSLLISSFTGISGSGITRSSGKCMFNFLRLCTTVWMGIYLLCVVLLSKFLSGIVRGQRASPTGKGLSQRLSLELQTFAIVCILFLAREWKTPRFLSEPEEIELSGGAASPSHISGVGRLCLLWCILPVTLHRDLNHS